MAFRKQSAHVPSPNDWEAGGEGFTDDRGPEGGDVDVSELHTGREPTVNRVRADLQAKLAGSLARTRYQILETEGPAAVRRFAFTVPFSGGDVASVQYLQGKPAAMPREDRVTHKFVRRWDAEQYEENGALSALFGPRGRPYGQSHVVLGNDKALHAMTGNAAELFLAVLCIIGPQYEGFFNGVAPGGPQRLHSQYWHKDRKSVV